MAWIKFTAVSYYEIPDDFVLNDDSTHLVAPDGRQYKIMDCVTTLNPADDEDSFDEYVDLTGDEAEKAGIRFDRGGYSHDLVEFDELVGLCELTF